ncbi:MAG: PEP-CTERM sorting domain-containing protein [Lacipirellulaceae bacterium]
MRLFMSLIAALAAAAAASPSFAQPVDFTTFVNERFVRTNGFPNSLWATTATTAQLDDTNPFTPSQNAAANILHGTTSILNKRIQGRLAPGPDDDVVGFVLGFNPGEATLGSAEALAADYLLVDWKGIDQNFDFTDVPADGGFFHDATIAGLMPAGLALSRVVGVPNADELWQHIDSEDAPDGGIIELQRGRGVGRTPYRRNYTQPHEFDITYTANRVTVIVDGALQLDQTGTFGDGVFGLYTGWQGPTPIFSDFVVSDAAQLPSAFPTATIDRATGELILRNTATGTVDFASYRVRSTAGSIEPSEWLSVSDNYDAGGPGSVDTDAWQVLSETDTLLSESEQGGTNGGRLAVGQSIDLGDLWTASRFEDLVLELTLPPSATFPAGLVVPVTPTYTGNAGAAFSRSDLNTDGLISLADWNLFYPNTLKRFSALSLVDAALLGDLDGDRDNDVNDFSLFKADYELANGGGSFARALAGAVPEPSAVLLVSVALAAFAARRRSAVLVLVAVASVGVGSSASAQALDFTQFTLEAYPNINFAEAGWTTTANVARVIDRTVPPDGNNDNTSPSVLYSPTNLRGNRIRGIMQPGTDDDVVGLMFGFQPGDASFGENSADANYLMIDWKGATQNFDFVDAQNVQPFNAPTPGGVMPAGLALSRVNGLANMDEKWQHVDLAANPLGGVTQLSRALTLGSTGYNRTASRPNYTFDVIWTEDTFVALVNGSLEFVERGEFGDGRFGVYTCCQDGNPFFQDFEVLPVESLDLRSLVPFADVNRDSGDIVVRNDTTAPITFDYYELRSRTGSLLPTWQGLADGESGGDTAPGLGWVEAGGSSTTALSEAFLVSAAGVSDGVTLNPGQSLTFRGAYNGRVNADDLQFVYRDSTGARKSAFVDYAGVGAPVSLPGDFNGDGLVNAADYTVWRDGGVLLNETNSIGVTDTADYEVWVANYGASASMSSASAVPEPAAALLLLLGVVALRRRR